MTDAAAEIRQQGAPRFSTGDPGAVPDRILGVVLAGGQGRRMGGAEKPLLPLAGVPMALRVAETLRAMTGAVVLATGHETARYQAVVLPCLPDPLLPLTVADEGRAGPLAGILAGLEEAGRRGYGWVLTCPADVPLVPPGLGAAMAAKLASDAAVCSGVTVEAPAADGRLRWHPAIALLPVSLAADLRRALTAGERRVGGWMQQAGVCRLQWASPPEKSAGAPDPFSNINTPDDLARAEAALAARRGTECD
ncbi:molybdenum cofactor guanylyltransferase [Novispirillum itersonii]|uniref:molybdenum cofactor guanylyltransferase n=1 Tax=Novispirillum itersonii TaxID=189 RepID=UPI00037CA5FE|nr:molybdenum cofactor guanylyltransferase [Novispirillum itersonii]